MEKELETTNFEVRESKGAGIMDIRVKVKDKEDKMRYRILCENLVDGTIPMSEVTGNLKGVLRRAKFNAMNHDTNAKDVKGILLPGDPEPWRETRIFQEGHSFSLFGPYNHFLEALYTAISEARIRSDDNPEILWNYLLHQMSRHVKGVKNLSGHLFLSFGKQEVEPDFDKYADAALDQLLQSGAFHPTWGTGRGGENDDIFSVGTGGESALLAFLGPMSGRDNIKYPLRDLRDHVDARTYMKELVDALTDTSLQVVTAEVEIYADEAHANTLIFKRLDDENNWNCWRFEPNGNYLSKLDEVLEKYFESISDLHRDDFEIYDTGGLHVSYQGSIWNAVDAELQETQPYTTFVEGEGLNYSGTCDTLSHYAALLALINPKKSVKELVDYLGRKSIMRSFCGVHEVEAMYVRYLIEYTVKVLSPNMGKKVFFDGPSDGKNRLLKKSINTFWDIAKSPLLTMYVESTDSYVPIGRSYMKNADTDFLRLLVRQDLLPIMGVVPAPSVVEEVIATWTRKPSRELDRKELEHFTAKLVDDQQTIAKFVKAERGAGYEGKQPCQQQSTPEDCEMQDCEWNEEEKNPVCGPRGSSRAAYVDEHGTLVLGEPPLCTISPTPLRCRIVKEATISRAHRLGQEILAREAKGGT
jgi:hypothetical protein